MEMLCMFSILPLLSTVFLTSSLMFVNAPADSEQTQVETEAVNKDEQVQMPDNKEGTKQVNCQTENKEESKDFQAWQETKTGPRDNTNGTSSQTVSKDTQARKETKEAPRDNKTSPQINKKSINHKEMRKLSLWKTIPAKGEVGPNEEVQNEEPQVNQNIQLTKEQIQELEKMNVEILKKRKKLIDKYVEFGVFSKDKGEKIKSHIDQRYQKMKEANFLPRHPHEDRN